MRKKAIVIGAGFSGLAAASSLAQNGFKVILVEKHETPGGRARQFTTDGFTFDMGPSWYWMPDVFDRFFARFGKKTADYYELERLDPSYRVVFGKDEVLDIPASMEELEQLFEKLEPGSSKKLQEFLKQAAYKYEVGVNGLVYKPSLSIMEFADPKLLVDMVRMDIFQSFHKHVRKFFRNDKLIRLIEFPILFLGAIPQNTPALYSLMNYADMALGTWYPKGGMFKIVEGMVQLAVEQGVEFRYGANVIEILVEGNRTTGVRTSKGDIEADLVVASADYNHVDQKLLPEPKRNYDDNYWENRVMAPSSLLFYIGLNKKLEGVLHHNLFFDEPLGPHAEDIYTNKKWPEKPLFYASVISKTDEQSAPVNGENLFLLIPIAPGLEDSEEIREKYFRILMDRLESLTEQSVQEHIVFKRSYAVSDFKEDYNAFKGNAYGLANTLMQTAILKPSLKSKKLKNLYFTGQLTVPGPGVPPSIISGQVVADQIEKEQN